MAQGDLSRPAVWAGILLDGGHLIWISFRNVHGLDVQARGLKGLAVWTGAIWDGGGCLIWTNCMAPRSIWTSCMEQRSLGWGGSHMDQLYELEGWVFEMGMGLIWTSFMDQESIWPDSMDSWG